MPIAPPGLLRRFAWLSIGALCVLELIARTGIARGPIAWLSPADADPFVGAMLLAAFVMHAAARPRLVEIGVTVLLGAGLAMVGLGRSSWLDLRSVIGVFGVGFGEASLVVLAVSALAAKGDARRAVIAIVEPAAAIAILALVLRAGADLAIALHPVTHDAIASRLDPAIAGARFDRALDRSPLLRDACLVAYHLSPIAIGVAWARGQRDEARAPIVEAVVAAGLIATAIAEATPILGPLRAVARFGASARFGVPSMHVVIASIVLASARRSRALAAAWLGVTIALALALGEARVVDVVLAPSLALLATALVAGVPWSRAERRTAAIAGASILVAWVLLLRNAASLLEARRAIAAPIALVSIAVPVALLRRLAAAPAEIALARTIDPAPKSSLARAVAPIFFASGFAGLVYEVVFGKQLALTFGSTAQAAAAVLATYMGGMALGSWAGGRLGARRADPLRVYALSELGIGLYCALSPLTFSLVRAAYVPLATSLGHGWIPVLTLVLGGLAMLPATFLMGVTMPVLTRRLIAEDPALGRAVGLLYGANTFGAAAGAFLAGYFMLPAFGITRSTWIAVALNVAAAAFGLLLSRRFGARSSEARPDDEVAAEATAAARREGAIARVILFGGGSVTLALEIAYTHLLAVVAGNSAYAFSLMLFAFLIGLGLGAALMRAAMRAFAVGLAVVGAVEIGLGIAILGGVFVWESIPAYFASFGTAGVWLGFAERELVRFAVCCVAMIPPAIFIGALYPAAMEIASRAHPRGPVVGVGRAAAINTAGNIAGAIAGSFLLLPALGSLRALHALAGLAAALGLTSLLAPAGRRAIVPIAASAFALLFAAQPSRFDLDRLASGANVYFNTTDRGPVVDHAESVSGGLTTVHEARERDGSLVRTMLTNGKFQGDDSLHRQVKAQFGFALSPLLHTSARERALVIGFGVGGTTRALRDAGFARTDVAELSQDILRLAGKHFRTTNDDVLAHSTVHAYVVDGRNFLLLSNDAYDLITIEITSVWFAGAAQLYNREFYALAKARLAEGGVLQQWVQLHHMHREDFISILATVRAEMPHVWVYLVGSQGMMIACREPCPEHPMHVAAIDRTPALRPVIEVFGGSAARLRDDELLDPAGVDRLLQRFSASSGRPIAELVSTDDDMRLEYRTPRGNVLKETASFLDNLRMLEDARKLP